MLVESCDLLYSVGEDQAWPFLVLDMHNWHYIGSRGESKIPQKSLNTVL